MGNNQNGFKKGHSPWNKGTKGVCKTNSGSFKKGLVPWIKGRHHTIESKKKMSESSKGQVSWNKGRIGLCSEETLKKMSINRKGKTVGKNHPFYGKHHTKESLEKMSKNRKGKLVGKDNPFYGKHHTEEVLQKNRKFHLGKHYSPKTEFKKGEIRFKGETASNWQGGKSFEVYGLVWTKQLKESIRERDNYVCQLCKKHQSQLKRKLTVHHIDYIKINTFTFNLISLCVFCHALTNFNRNHWTSFFRNYMEEKYGYNYINLNQKTFDKIKDDYGEDVKTELKRFA